MSRFVVNWAIPTGERLSRYRDICREYPTAADAIAALAAPWREFKAVSGMARELLDEPGKCRVLATRRNGKPLVRK